MDPDARSRDSRLAPTGDRHSTTGRRADQGAVEMAGEDVTDDDWGLYLHLLGWDHLEATLRALARPLRAAIGESVD